MVENSRLFVHGCSAYSWVWFRRTVKTCVELRLRGHCGATHLDLFHSASHASCLTTSVFGAFSGCSIWTWWGWQYVLNMVMSNMRRRIVLRMSREVLIGWGTDERVSA